MNSISWLVVDASTVAPARRGPAAPAFHSIIPSRGAPHLSKDYIPTSSLDDLQQYLGVESLSSCGTPVVCPPEASLATELNTKINFYMACLIGPFALFGIVGNVLSIFVLRRDRGARAMSLLLQALSVGNALLLAIAFFGRMIPDVYSFTNISLLEAYFDYVYVFGLQYFTICYDVVHMFVVYIILYAAFYCSFLK